MPVLSVIMPVYNGEEYLKEAIESILGQTFADFELLAINDGSNDGSESVIRAYSDPRIIYIKNETNIGLIGTLNKGIDQAKGKFIARMDQDDIALPERFMTQLQYLENDPEAVVVGSPIIGITPGGKTRDHWPDDIRNKTSEQIRHTLPLRNCISHPTIMIRAEVLKRYRYTANQKGSEDWDLWLRLARDGKRIIKTSEVLLRYRIHEASITRTISGKLSSQLKSVGVKGRFFMASVSSLKINGFVLRSFFSIFRDLGYDFKTRILPRVLRRTKWLFTIDPFTAYRQFCELRSILKSNRSRFFLFFPYSHIGGAEKVHAEITRLLEDQMPYVFITGLHNKNPYPAQFGQKTNLLHVAAALYHPFFSRKAEKLFIRTINESVDPIVFGANNLFFDSLVLKIRPDIYVVDLTHDIDYRSTPVTPQNLSAILRCDVRIFVSNQAVRRTLEFYDQNFIDDHYKERIQVIYNCVDIPGNIPAKEIQNAYKVLYAGRDTPEKAVHRIAKLAAKCLELKLPFEFVFVGDIRSVPEASNVKLHGLVVDRGEISRIYSECQFVIISSLSEGFPLSLAEGMAHGCIPVATAVGDIPFHIRNGVTGFTVRGTSEDVPAEFADILMRITGDEKLMEQLSLNAREYAQKTFSREEFVRKYKNVFKLQRPAS